MKREMMIRFLFLAILGFVIAGCLDSFDAMEINEGSDAGQAVDSAGESDEGLYAIDTDGDGVSDNEDNCPSEPNPVQKDTDGDGVGDVCDICPTYANPDQSTDECPGGMS